VSETSLFLLQRLSALVLAPLVLVHLGVILYAVRGGLSAAEILGRTQGSIAWAGFYGLFVVMAALHGALGLRNVIGEWTPLTPRTVDAIATATGMGLLALGVRAVYAVVAA
jgi:fumarate reductase subunit C